MAALVKHQRNIFLVYRSGSSVFRSSSQFPKQRILTPSKYEPFLPIYTSFTYNNFSSRSVVAAKETSPSQNAVVKQKASSICESLQSNKHDIENVFANSDIRLSSELLSEVLENLQMLPELAIKFFAWAKSRPEYSPCAAAYNQIIDILGKNQRFEDMKVVIDEMSALGFRLTDAAFSFLRESPANASSVQELFRTFKSLDVQACRMAYRNILSFLAKQNVHLPPSTIPREIAALGQLEMPHVLIAYECRSGRISDALKIVAEMKKAGRGPDSRSFNYILGSLTKRKKLKQTGRLLEEMGKSSVEPDAFTYHALISGCCNMRKLDKALSLMSKMLEDGIRPNFITYSCCIRAFFDSSRRSEAHDFVEYLSCKDPSARSYCYGVLARLYLKHQMGTEAHKVVVDWIGKGLRPDNSICAKLKAQLRRRKTQKLLDELELKLLGVNSS